MGWRQTWGALLLAMSLVVLLSMLTYRVEDISVFQAPVGQPTQNCFGPFGAWMSYCFFQLMGLAAYTVPFWCVFFGCLLMFKPETRMWPRLIWLVLFMLSLSMLFELQPSVWRDHAARLNIGRATGGVFAHHLTAKVFVRVLNPSGAAIVAVLVLLISGARLVGVGVFVAAYKGVGEAMKWLAVQVEEWMAQRRDARDTIGREARRVEKQRMRLEKAIKNDERASGRGEDRPAKGEERPAKGEQAAPTAREKAASEAKAAAAAAKEKEEQEKADKLKLRREELERQQEAAKREVAEKRALEMARRQQELEKKAQEKAKLAATAPADQHGQASAAPAQPYQLPPIDLLNKVPPAKDRAIKGDVETTKKILQETLAEFGIGAEVVNVEEGPVVTRYELLPAPGVRVERIESLSNNLALALKSSSVRVQAPVPGKGVVGVEVPNATSSMVYLREILEGDEWKTNTTALPMVLGKDVGGQDVVADLAGMPHLLIAGTTGSGKTVCINSILLSLLMCRSPEQLRLMLVDPKIVELAAYDKLPHLVVPVINDPHKVTYGLRWAINEMEKRYKWFSKAGVRNIEGYNNRRIETQVDLFAKDQADGDVADAEPPLPRKLPYIVIVVDELADLMLVAQADIENCIARLAQLSRAVGIHMILATQRPSVNVITGTIKANFPARIAFQVAQKVDSRTILDANGADRLLGRGDMLFLPAGANKLLRAQGAMVKDEEISRVLDFIKKQVPPTYETAVQEKMQSSSGGGVSGDSEPDDEMLEQAIQILRETRRASTSALQRRLRIGYTRAARLMDTLEERGIVGPPRGSDPREILIDLDEPAAQVPGEPEIP